MRSRRSARRSSAASERRRLDPALRLALVLLVAGLALTVLGTALRPEGMGTDGIVARRGPAVTRFDEANGTTTAVFYCGHWHCGPALVFEGDVRAELERPRVYLMAGRGVDAEDAWRTVPIPPLETRDSPVVTEAYAGPFVLASAGPRLLPLVVGPLLAATGLGFALRKQGRLAPAWTTVGGAAGVALGVVGAGMGDGMMFILLVAMVLGLVGVTLLIFRRTRMAGIALALLGAIGMLLTFVASPWFPSVPAI